MRRITIRHLFFFFVIWLGWASLTHAEQTAQSNVEPAGNPYTKGRISLQLVSGALFSLTNLPEDSPVFDYAQTNLRLGWVLSDPGPQNHFLRGAWEGLAEITNSIIFDGFGSYMGGITALIRYNFVQPDWAVVPYVQGGVGIVYNNAYEDENQQAIGQAIEFTPQFSVGFHYLITQKWSLGTEAMFHHISNANMAKRNRGINAVGGFLGVTYRFSNN